MIPRPLAGLLEPLEAFEAIRRRAVRLGARVCDLSYANPFDGVTPRAREVLRRVLEEERTLDLQYTPFGGWTPARRAVADALAATHLPDADFRDVILTPGAMAALHLALRAAGQPGDEVVIPVPCWLDYPTYARCLGLAPVLVELEGPAFALDPDRIADAVGPRTCALLLSQPANPTGRCHRPRELRALADVLAHAEQRSGRPITWISDETHRDLLPRGIFRSPAEVWARTVVVYSFGKYHALQGQRIGYAAVSPRHPERRETADELVRWARITGACTPTALMQRALPALLRLEHDLAPLDAWRQRVRAGLAEAGYRVAPADGTFFLYAAVPDGRDDWEFVETLAARGVLVLPSAVFHHTGHFRISLTGSASMLERALAVFREVAGS